MTGNIALDVVIGLVFVFLLYSLMASVIAEIFASFLGFRAKNLHRGIVRMLEEEKKPTISYVKGLSMLDKLIDILNDMIESLSRFFNTDYKAVKKFYDHPSVKFLARDKFFSKPSYIAPDTFSKVSLDLIKKGQKGTELKKIKSGLAALMKNEKFLNDVKTQLESDKPDFTALKKELAAFTPAEISHFDTILDEIKTQIESPTPDIAALKKIIAKNNGGGFISGETLTLINSFLEDANEDVEKFKLTLEHWFNTTMDRVAGWYKRKNQLVLLIIGFSLAACFNASTIEIVKKLSKDDAAREQMVQLATAYVQNNPDTALEIERMKNDSTSAPQDLDAISAKLDSLLSVKEKLSEDMQKANDVMGFGHADSIKVVKIASADLDSIKKHLTPNQRIISDSNYLITFKNEYQAIDGGHFYSVKKKNGKVVTAKNGTTYAYMDDSGYFWDHILGYLLTALAISLGAPFWFDLLNKLVKLRSSVQPSSAPQKGKDSTPTTPESPIPGA